MRKSGFGAIPARNPIKKRSCSPHARLRRGAIDAPARAIDHHEAAGAALAGRLLRDQLFGKVEIEIGDVRHAAGPFG